MGTTWWHQPNNRQQAPLESPTSKSPKDQADEIIPDSQQPYDVREVIESLSDDEFRDSAEREDVVVAFGRIETDW